MNYQQKYIKYKKKYLNLKDSKMSVQRGGISINEARRQFPDGDFYLFSYGSNGIAQLAERLGVDPDLIRQNSSAAKLEGWRRGFFSYSDGWGGSVATIYADAGAGAGVPSVSGIALRMSRRITGDRHAEYPARNFFVGDQQVGFNELLTREAVQHDKYIIRPLGNIRIFNRDIRRYQNAGPTCVFIGNRNYQPENNELRNLQGAEPSEQYTEAIADTLRDRRELAGFNRTPDIDIDIRIWRGNRWVDGDPIRRTYRDQP